jgi:hypothetical protein
MRRLAGTLAETAHQGGTTLQLTGCRETDDAAADDSCSALGMCHGKIRR